MYYGRFRVPLALIVLIAMCVLVALQGGVHARISLPAGARSRGPYSVAQQMRSLSLMRQIQATDEAGSTDILSQSLMFFSKGLPRCLPSVPTTGPKVVEFHSTEYKGFPLSYPKYRQFIKKSNKKYSGCGATAWAMVAAWYAHNPSLDVSSAALKDLFPVPYQRTNTNKHIIQIGKAVKSFSNIFMGKNTATMPWDMHRITSMPLYSDMSVSRSYKITVAMQRKCPLGKIWKCAVARIKEGRPVIVGYGSGVNLHYAMARAFVKHKDGKEYLYLNNGWGGKGNGWLSDKYKLFFAGYFDQ